MVKQKWDALRIADWFEAGLGGCEMDAAAELRRLHAENVLLHERHHFDNGVLAELLEALKKRDSVEQHLNSEIENHSAAVYEATKLLSEAREQRDELLEALRLAVHLNERGVPMTDEELRKARAAIAKAEGEPK
jgi:hypothetical protein